MLTPTGHVSEASAANIFVVRDGELITPPISDNILAGVTRDTVITLARDMGFIVQEQSLTRSELYVADEAFLTGTAAEIIPVASVDDRPTAQPAVDRSRRGCATPSMTSSAGATPPTGIGSNTCGRPEPSLRRRPSTAWRCSKRASPQLADAAAHVRRRRPAAVARREEAADRAVDLIAARAWQSAPGRFAWPRADGRAVRRLRGAADAACRGRNDGARDRVRAHRGGARSAHTRRTLRRRRRPMPASCSAPHRRGGCRRHGRWWTTRCRRWTPPAHEWVGADPATVAAAGWVLVDRMGRLLIAAALVAEAARGGPAAATELLVNAARRYAWNHLRGPAPEAATATHVQRSADLMRAVQRAPKEVSLMNSALRRLGLSCSPAIRPAARWRSAPASTRWARGCSSPPSRCTSSVSSGSPRPRSPWRPPLPERSPCLRRCRWAGSLTGWAQDGSTSPCCCCAVSATAASRSSRTSRASLCSPCCSPLRTGRAHRIQQAVVTAVIGGQDRTRTMASIRAVRNIGLTVGFLLAGAAFAAAEPSVFIAIFVGNGLSFVVVAVMVRRVLSRAGAVVERTAPAAATAVGGGSPIPVPRSVVHGLHRRQWRPVALRHRADRSAADLGHRAHRGTGCVGARLDGGQHGADGAAPGLRRQIRRQSGRGDPAAGAVRRVDGDLLRFLRDGSGGVGATFAILAILVAVVVLSVAENIQEVAAWELSAELSPEAARARYLGAFSLGFSGQKVIGPTLLVVVLLPTGLIAWPVLAGSLRDGSPDLANSGTPLSGRAWHCRHSSVRSTPPTHRGEIMTEHVLVVGSGRDLPARVRRARPGTETSVICRLEFVAKAPRTDRAHPGHRGARRCPGRGVGGTCPEPPTSCIRSRRIATFGETDQDRCAVIGEALGITTHSPRTVELVHDKHAMRARLRETGIDTTASAVVG